MLEMFEIFLSRVKKRPRKINEKEQKISEIESEIDTFERGLGKKSSRKKVKEFYSLIRGGFRKMLDLKYAATFQEIEREITKRKYKQDIIEEAGSLLQSLTVMEYSPKKLTDFIKQEQNDKEKTLRKYVKKLEKSTKDAEKDAKKRIYELVVDKAPKTDAELMLRLTEKYREILRKL